MTTATYSDGEAVELFDRVEFTLDGWRFTGQVTRIWNGRRHAITVRFLDYQNRTRDGEPRLRSRRIGIDSADLIGRDG